MKRIQNLFLFVVAVILLAANAHAGRWITRDPMEVQEHMERDPQPFLDLNPYTFNNNNPLSYIDPDGMAPQLVTVTGNLNGGLTGAGYVDYHQGQDYGIGLNGPLNPRWDRYTEWADQNSARFHDSYPGLASTVDSMIEYGPYGMGAMGELGELGQLGKLGKLKCPPKGPTLTPREGIYEFTGKKGKPYVGQSGNIPQRLQQHLDSGKLVDENTLTVKTTDVPGGKTAREIAEQRRLNQLGGPGSTENIRNPIGPARRYLLE